MLDGAEALGAIASHHLLASAGLVVLAGHLCLPHPLPGIHDQTIGRMYISTTACSTEHTYRIDGQDQIQQNR